MTTVLNTFDRQCRIPGWRQERLVKSRVVVNGRGWLGAFVVWALDAMGIGEITWIGRPRPATDGAAQFLLGRPDAGSGSTILADPFDIEYGPELPWALEGVSPDILVSTTESLDELSFVLDWADKNRVRALAGRISGGGWFGTDPRPVVTNHAQNPAIALAVAAMLVDAVRERLCPLSGGVLPPEKALGLNEFTLSSSRQNVLVVGVGGIGAWAAAAVCAALGDRVHVRLADCDRVAPENLNRQALFTQADALAQFPKAAAAYRSLKQIFPQADLAVSLNRIGPEDAARIDAMVPRPTVILSAVDNAASRLALQQLGRDLALPIIQGGTGLFAADCLTQTVSGPLLDDQMHGALSAAAARESQEGRRNGACTVDPSYVVPGMMAAALMTYRLGQIDGDCQCIGSGCCADVGQPFQADVPGAPGESLASGTATSAVPPSLPPIRWRSGDYPVETKATPHEYEYDFADLLGRLAALLPTRATAQQAGVQHVAF
jgi:molybdopterin/thiamine biosynthesis adenylyltransferase